jgi:hypothetical protein
LEVTFGTPKILPSPGGVEESRLRCLVFFLGGGVRGVQGGRGGGSNFDKRQFIIYYLYFSNWWKISFFLGFLSCCQISPIFTKKNHQILYLSSGFVAKNIQGYFIFYFIFFTFIFLRQFWLNCLFGWMPIPLL